MLSPAGGAPTLIVGLGSPHGDDQLGWRLAERIAAARPPRATVRIARQPAEILHWLPAAGSLHVCDAYAGAVGKWRRWQWPELPCPKGTPRTSGHSLSLADALAVAQEVGWLPGRVIIWGLAGADFSPASAISPGADRACDRVIAHLMDELHRA